MIQESPKPEEMNIIGIEVIQALNQRPGPSGISPAMILFGQKLKMHGEIYGKDGTYTHPAGTEPTT